MKTSLKKGLALLMAMIMVLPAAITAEGAIEKSNEPVTIVFTHDMHSHLEKFPKLKTLIRGAEEKWGPVCVFDAGDFSMGTPYQTIYKTEASELRAMGATGYDVTTLGNHEFDQRSEGLTAMLNTAVKSKDPLPAMVNSNIDWDKTLKKKEYREDGLKLQKALEDYGSEEYTIIEKNGVRIGVFGIFGKNSASYAPESGTYFKDPVESAKAVVAELKEKENPDMIVCVSHSGTNEDPDKSEDEILAKKVNGIDLIVSGHTHTELRDPIIQNNTVIVSTGQYNTKAGIVNMAYNDGRYVLAGYNLVALDEDIPDDPETAALISGFKKKADENYFSSFGLKWDQVLTNNPVEFTDIDSFSVTQGEDTLGNLISDALIYGVKEAEGKNYEEADLAIVPGGCIRGSFDLGPVTVEEAFNALSLGTGPDGIAGYPLVSVYLSGKELKLAAEIDASVSDLMKPARLYFSGLGYTYSPSRMFLNRACDIHLMDKEGNPEEIQDNKLYRCVADLYSAQMLGTVEGLSHGLLAVTPKDKNGNPVKDFEQHIIRNHKGEELKEWYALASYLKSFEDSGIPERYAFAEGRKVYDSSKGLVAFFRSPNQFMISAMAITFVLFVLICTLLICMVRKIRKRKKEKQ